MKNCTQAAHGQNTMTSKAEQMLMPVSEIWWKRDTVQVRVKLEQ